MEPGDAASRFGLGQVWRYDWLKYLEPASRDLAIENFSNAARLDPRMADAWIMLVPLLVERGELRAAAAAARRGLDDEASRPDAELASAYTAYRLGDVARADSLFNAAIPRLPRAIRSRFEDIAPVATEADTIALRRLWPRDRPAFIRRFWRSLDPDLATPENEVQLEYWSRVAHAYLLWYDARRQAWDERGEMYVRYGAPARETYNGIGEALSISSPVGLNLPTNVLVWEYPELGMRVTMQDRLLNGFYMPELVSNLIYGTLIDPTPDPDSLARRGDLLGSAGGRGVFSAIPPGARPLPLDSHVARFEGANGPRLLGDLEVPSDPGDSLIATWVVRDSTETEVARATRALSPSACAPTEAQVADFASDLPPGLYQVGLSVRGSGGRRGAEREAILLWPVERALALSDIVVTCGVPDESALEGPAPAVRLEANPRARVAPGQPLTAYFEIYHLLADGGDGLAHFEFEYTVRSIERDSRVWLQRVLAPRPQPQPIHTRREEQQVGSLRRQFVSVPAQSLPAGHYRLEIRVRDLVSGQGAEADADFVREPSPVLTVPVAR
jgi:GWxTD domain-containing protein